MFCHRKLPKHRNIHFNLQQLEISCAIKLEAGVRITNIDGPRALKVEFCNILSISMSHCI